MNKTAWIVVGIVVVIIAIVAISNKKTTNNDLADKLNDAGQTAQDTVRDTANNVTR